MARERSIARGPPILENEATDNFRIFATSGYKFQDFKFTHFL